MNNPKCDKIVLVALGAPRLQFGALHHLPLALLSLAAWLREKGTFDGNIKVLDTKIQPPRPIDFSDASVVGLSAMTGSQIRYGLEVAKQVRIVNPKTVIVWGGIHPSLLPEETVNHPLVDFVVVGEGEQTFLELLNAIRAGESTEGIAGLCYKKSNGEVVVNPKRPFLDMDQLPLPAYDLIDIDKYHGIRFQFDYQSSRGCPFRCSFCYNQVFCGRRYRMKSPGKVLEELLFLHGKYDVESFGFVDDEFFIDQKRTEKIFDGILLSKKKFEVIASCRLDIVQKFSQTLLKKIKQAGVSQIFFGAESGAAQILKQINKDITTADIINGAKLVAMEGIRPNLSFMSGFPDETLDDFKQTIDIIQKLWRTHPLITVNGIFPFNPYPGTALYQRAIERGAIVPQTFEEWGEWSFQYEPDHPWIDKKMKEWMEISFYMVRFKYYLSRYEERHKGKLRVCLIKIITWPMIKLVKLRMQKRWFHWAWEWKIFAFLARRTFGFL